MKIFIKNIITIRGLQECGHARDFETQGVHSHECGTCRVLLGLAQVRSAFQWDFNNISQAEDYIHLLPSSNFVYDLLPSSDRDEAKLTLSPNSDELSYAIWVPWTLGFRLRRVRGHPIVRKLLQQDVVKVTIRTSFSKLSPLPGYGTDSHIWNYWIQSSLAKRPGSIYSQMPDAKVETVLDPPLPTRVLDLMPDSFPQHVTRTLLGPEHLTVRLVAPPPDTKGKYLTLSHRWGPECRLQTTKANQDKLTKGILFHSLPKTYRDAAIVATRLGYRYLWIDSLCIVQDDPDDWLRESATMSTIYRNSHCTIAAHGSENDSDGFLDAALAPQQKHILGSQRPSTINSRGWVFQERILSRRILHFVHGAVLFEDASGFYRCKYDDDDDDSVAFRRPMGSEDIILFHPLATDRKQNLEDSVEKGTSCQWYELVEKYTRCQLTYDTDRLPALRGLSRYYQEVNGESLYLYGLWYSSFHKGLLWIVTSASPRMAVGYEGAAVPEPPSWSWARWPNIQYPCHLDRCKPLEFSVLSPQPGDPGLSDRQMAGSKIVTLQANVLHQSQDIIAERMEDGWPCSDFRESPPHRYNLVNTLMGRRPAWLVFDGQCGEEVRYKEPTLAFISLFTNTITSYRVNDDGAYEPITSYDYNYYFLILEKVDATTTTSTTWSNRYRRIGMGVVKWKSWFDNAKREVIEIE